MKYLGQKDHMTYFLISINDNFSKNLDEWQFLIANAEKCLLEGYDKV